MYNIKSKILAYKYVRAVFAVVFLIGTVGFVFFSMGVNSNVVRNGSISIVLMLSGLGMVKYCNIQISALICKLKSIKRNKPKNNKKIIEFDKIA
ncbi:MAG: hypothetical protein ACI39F_03820 [Acutalibacteraceae bacterium]